MFEHVPDYPMAVTAASGADATAVQLAVKWLLLTTDAVGGQPLVYAPNRPSIREWPILAGLDGPAVVTTWKAGRASPRPPHQPPSTASSPTPCGPCLTR